MSISKKIAEIQQKLLKKSFKTKKGFHGEYIPLQEMLPPILEACLEKEVTLYFTSTTEHFMLKLMSWDGKEEFSARVRLPELSKDEKDEGKKITYLKRYLLMNTFMILEESVDPDDLPDVASSAKNNKGEKEEIKDVTPEQPPRDINLEELLEKAVTHLRKKGLTEDEISLLSLKNCIFRLDNFSNEEKKEIESYCKVYIRDRRNSK